jgi:hypothetical protein
MKSEKVICFLPFGTAAEKQALRQVKDMGFTAVQTYTFWRDYEPAKRGKFSWAANDKIVQAIQDAGLKYVPFLLMGPKYAAPDWWLADPAHVGLRCLEHGKECPIESVWSPAFRREISRVLEAFAEHYLPWNVLESVQPGICGDYGEAIFPVLGNWPGDYHTHRGFWCGGDDAIDSFRQAMLKKYDSLDGLNRAWRSTFLTESEVCPFLRQLAPSRTAFFDLISWYQESMTDYSEFWMKECRRIFPDIPAYLCTGGADDEITSGALFAAQAKAAAKHRGGIRLTNEVNKFYENVRLTAHTHAACEFYGAYLGLEPVGPITAEGVRARNFGSAVYGNRQMFHYYHNFFTRDDKPLTRSINAMRETQELLQEREPEKGIAFFWPVDQGIVEGAMPAETRQALMHIRRHYPISAISEQMILDGALKDYGCLLMIGATTARAEVLKDIAKWVKTGGGRFLATTLCRDLELDPVLEFDGLFGITKKSEEAWGHVGVDVRKTPGFDRLGKISDFHCERGWLGLADGTEKIAVAKKKPGQSGTVIHAVSPLFRRTYGKTGQALLYTGYVNLEIDPQAAFADPGVALSLLDDFCAMSGIKPLGTRPDEIARGRIGGKTLILREDSSVVVKTGT